MDQCIRKHSTTISRNLGLSSPNEIVSGWYSCMSCSMHKIRSCAHTLHTDQESGVQAGVELELWKKLFKGWTVSFEGWSEAARWTEERRMSSRRRRRTDRQLPDAEREKCGENRVADEFGVPVPVVHAWAKKDVLAYRGGAGLPHLHECLQALEQVFAEEQRDHEDDNTHNVVVLKRERHGEGLVYSCGALMKIQVQDAPRCLRIPACGVF